MFAVGALLGALALSAAGDPGCVRPTAQIAADQVIGAADLEAAPCAASSRSPYRYDPSLGAVRASRSLHKGEILARPPAFGLADIHPGDRLYLRVQIGPTVVVRPVEAMQAARPGEKLFVRTGEGDVFPVQFAEVRP